SRLMGEDELGTIRTLTAYRELMGSLIQQHRGRVVDTVGDNLLAEFGSVVDAVACAVEVQRELARRNAELPDHRKMEFRIGINLGDVIVEGERIYGDGVNIAARVEGLADAGGICISGKVYDEIKSKLALGYESLGERTVKNIAEPLRVYRVLSVHLAAADQATPSTQAVRFIPAYTEATTIGLQPLVGRENEMSFLQEKVDSAVEGKGSVVFITGQAGIGKTRLAREVRDYAQGKGFQWLEGKYEKAVSQPYKAWTDIVRNCLHLRGASLQNMAGPYAVHLAKIVPELAERLECTPTVVQSDPESERFRLFEGLTQFFVHVSHEAPLVLFLDDLQWASSIELVHYLSRSIGNQRILTLATYRDDDLKENASLWRTMLAMNRERLFHSLPLKALDEGDVGRLMSSTVEGSVAPKLLETIYQRTEGNPFFVEEVVRFLREREAIVRTEAGWDVRESSSLETPDSVKVVITERLEQLGQDAEEALCMASVIGREFPLHLLEELVNQGGEELLGVIDRCERAGLIVSKPVPGEEVFSFTHDLMHEALYEGIGSVHRRRHHLKIGQAMEKLYGTRLEDRYDVLAHHFFEGNDLKKAVEYGELAARRAIGVHSFSNAVRLLEKVLEAQAVVDPNDRAKRCDLLFTLGSALGPAGESQRVADMVAPEALKLAEA
ncbi:MAG: BREX system ATP-binding domain-containing protein, partial [Candidatus Binatia bacterium]